MKRPIALLSVLAAAAWPAACSVDEKLTPVDSGIEAGGDDAGDGGIPCGATGVSKGPWTLAMNETAITVRWEACRAGTSSGVTYTPEAGGASAHADGWERAAQTSETYVAALNPKAPPDYAGTWWMHEARITNLAPSTCYRFTLDADPAQKGRFCTSRKAGEPFRFMAIGDTHPELGDNTSRVFSHVVWPDPAKAWDFSLHMGDIQYYSGGLATWASWFPLMAPELRAGATLVAMGNHELEKPWEYTEYSLRFFGGSGFDGSDEHYRFESGGVWFFTVDTEGPTDPQSLQGQWLSAQLADASKRPGYRFSVLWIHRPYLTCGDTSDNEPELAAWGPTFDQYGVRLILQGHMHGYERFRYGGRTVITTAGGGGSIADPNKNAQRAYCGAPDAGADAGAGARASWGPWYHAMVFSVSAGKLHGDAIDTNGTVVDAFDDVVP